LRADGIVLFASYGDRYPNIRFILAHAGGTLSFLSFRLASSPTIDAGRLGKTTADQVRGYLRRFWYDTALSAGPASLAALKQVVDMKQVLFGSDWPYAKEPVTGETVAAIDTSEVLSDDERAAIRVGNARTLFPRLHPALEREGAGDSACWLPLVCDECGALVTSPQDHRPNCRSSVASAARDATREKG
jgi:hypothetical protein